MLVFGFVSIYKYALSSLQEEANEKKERRPFDREIDLQVNRFDEAQRKNLIKKSAKLDSRFSHGKDKVFL